MKETVLANKGAYGCPSKTWSFERPDILSGCSGFYSFRDIRYGASVVGVRFIRFLNIGGSCACVPNNCLGNKSVPIAFVEAHSNGIGVNSGYGL